MSKLSTPGDDTRTLIVGRTGSGKTIAALYQLSLRSYRIRPWIVIDYKNDVTINSIEGVEYLGLEDALPSLPGIYIVQPRPDEEGLVERLLWRIWERGGIGIYVDEGYMLPDKGKSPAFQAILTQGRSKQIPVIILSQRPVWLSRFAVSESEYYQVYWLNDERDRKTIGAFLPLDSKELNERLPEYHSLWYDVKRDRLVKLKPVPHPREIVADIERNLEEMAREREAVKPPRIRRL